MMHKDGTRRVLAVLRRIWPWVLAVACSFGFIQVLSPARYQMGALQIDVRAMIRWPGDTVIAVPPFGEVWASTHTAPTRIELTLSGLNLPELQRTLQTAEDRDDFVRRLGANWQQLAWRFGIRMAIFGALGGLFSLLLPGSFFWRRSGRNSAPIGPLGKRLTRLVSIVSPAAIGALVGAVLAISTAATFERNAFKNPRYAGVLQAAPWIVDLIDRGLDHIDDLGKKLETISKNLEGVLDSVNGLEAVASPSPDIRILHVSDIHNNPAGLDFILQVAENFHADLIIDTGDITDYGTSIEASLAERIERLRIPYVFIPGNHDSPESVARLRRMRGVVVLDGRGATIKGLTIYGVGDPAGRKGDIIASAEDYRLQAANLAEHLRNQERAPDILAVHSRKSAVNVDGFVPVILHGHDHKASIQQAGGSVVVDAGTSGAAGIRALQTDEAIPYSVALLHFKLEESDGTARARLMAADAIRVFEPRGKLLLERRVFGPGEAGE